MNNYNLFDTSLEEFLDKQIAYSWTVVAMVLSAISNVVYDIRTYGVVNSFEIVGVTLLYSIGTVVVSWLFTIYGYSILEWEQKNEDCSGKAYMLKSMLFAIFGMCLALACMFLTSKSLFLTDEKYIINSIIPVLVFLYISLFSCCSVFAFLISAMDEAHSSVKGDKENGDKENGDN